jgi:hypothetical protein
MQIRAVFVAAFLLSSSAAALAESRSAFQSVTSSHATSCDTAVLSGTLRSEGRFARSLCRRTVPVCTSAINYSTRQHWASSQ